MRWQDIRQGQDSAAVSEAFSKGDYMALNFNPPEGLINDYINRKQPAELANQGIQQALQTYMQLKQQQQQQAYQQQVLASTDAERKAKEFGAIAPYIPEEQIPAYAKSMGLNIPQMAPASTPGGAEPNFSAISGEQQQVTPMGSPIIAHFNSLMSQQPGQSAMTPGGGPPPMGPRPTSKYGSQEWDREVLSRKNALDLQPNQMYDQAGKLIGTLPPNAKVVPVERPAPPTPEDREKAKLDAKLAKEKPNAKASLNDALRNYDSLIAEAKAIQGDPDLSHATGMLTPAAHIPGTGARRVADRIETLKSKTLLNTLGSLKSLSANGSSGFGQLSNQEGEALRSAVTSLDRGQSTDDFKASIDRLIQDAQFHRQNLLQKYSDTYGEDFAPSSSGSSSAGGWSYVGKK